MAYQNTNVTKVAVCSLCVLTALTTNSVAQTISWKGYTWTVKSGTALGPGPNTWSASNVSIDSNGYLHLKITNSTSGWTCAEVTGPNLGFGTYQWQVEGPIDKLDKNVVLGLFGYKGPDGVNEIDVEFAHWGNASYNIGNWTVYPSSGTTKGSQTFPLTLSGTYTTSRYTWSSTGVQYWLMGGHQPIGTTTNVIQTWNYTPATPLTNITQTPIATSMNLWLFQGHAPSDGKPVEIIIHDFKKV